MTGHGNPLRDICVAAVSFDSRFQREAVTAKSGKYRIGKLPVGRCVVLFSASLQPFGGITGTVSTTGNAPVAGECVVAVPQNTDPDPLAGIPQPTETAISGNSGRYSLIDVPPGQYKIEFTSGCGATGLATQWWDGVTLAATATVVTVQPATALTGIDATLHH